MLLAGCVDPPDEFVEPPAPDYPFYTENLIEVKGTKDSPRDFTKVLTDYAITSFDFVSSQDVWSGKWTLEVTGENMNYNANVKVACSSDETVSSATVSQANSSYVFAMVGNTAYYNFNGSKRSYDGNIGGRQLLSSVLPVKPLTPKQKDLLRSAWMMVPFIGDITYGTNSGGRVSEYSGNINVTNLLINIAAMSTTGDNSESAVVINKIKAMLLTLINAAFDKNLTEINKDSDLPQIKAETHLVTQFKGSTETLKEIYVILEIDGKKGNLLHIKDFSLTNGRDEFNAKASIGDTDGYTETDDEGYAALLDGVASAHLKEKFKFISDYFTEIAVLFS